GSQPLQIPKDQLMRPPARLILSGAALLLVVSCVNDAPVTPSLSAPPVAGSPALASVVDPTPFDVVIPAGGGHISVAGLFALDVPASAVCDPDAQDSQDGYAAAAWDSACTPATTDITVHATLHWSNTHLWADFAPALRFVPTAD